MARVAPGNAPLELLGYGTVVNWGPGTVFYGDDQFVSTSSFDGQLNPGDTTTISGGMWFVASGQPAEVAVINSPTSSGGTSTVVSGAGGSAVGAVVPAEVKRKLWLPTGLTTPSAAAAGDAIDVTLDGRLSGSASVVVVSGEARGVGGLVLPAGRTLDSITFVSGSTAGAGLTNTVFFAVNPVTGAVLAKSADDASTTWPVNTPRTLLMATPYTATQDTPIAPYLLVTGTTMPTLSGVTTLAAVEGIGTGPSHNVKANTGLTNAASIPATITPATTTSNRPWASINSKTPAPAADVSEGLGDQVLVGTVSATTTVLFKPVMFPITVRAASLVLNNTAVAASDTDFWTVDIGKIPALSSTFGSIMATKTTQATGGVAFLTNQVWTFDAVTWTAANQTLVKDDILAFRFTKTGAPTNLQGMTAAVRWQVA